jgi:hypothetical protein
MSFKYNDLHMDPVKRMNFEEFLTYKLRSSRKLKFSEFNRICGISKPQWELFRMQNMEHGNIDWIIE